jgi:hypothetical protein
LDELLCIDFWNTIKELKTVRIKELFAQHTRKVVISKVMDTFKCRRYIALIHVGR